ncbi:hypothetical protein [Serratia sp. TSA_105.2]|uniref:hypothetical protein n=1 Tax=Serratia sp. TSA_105.2 TaxID=3415660 RepID=UPI004046C0A4
MTSFIKLGIFEREAKTPELKVRQLALLLCGEDPETRNDDIPDDKIEAYGIYYRHISKWLSSSRLFRGSNSSAHRADYMFALAYPLIDEDLTPEPIKKRCLDAVEFIAVRAKGKEILYALGGDELQQKGIELSKNKRGLHRKETERDNTEKLVAMLVKLLAKKVGGPYGTIEKPIISVLLADMEKLAKDNKLSMSGLARATVYKKISDSLNSIEYDED